MLINTFHKSLRTLANIGQSQYYPPEDIDIHINNALKAMYAVDYEHFEATQEITDTLGYYKAVSEPIELTDGIVDTPADLYHLTGVEAIMSDDSRVPCETLADSYWFGRKHSKSFAPSEEYPIARQIGLKQIEILPVAVEAEGEQAAIIGVKSVVLLYLRKPDEAKYDYVVNPSGTGWTFNAAGSIEVDYPEIRHNKIQDKALLLLGIALRDNTLIGGESIREKGNQ